MKKFIITTIVSGNTNIIEARSEANMWNLLRAVRDQLTEADLSAEEAPKALVTTEDGTLFKDITFKRNTKGKVEMPNAVKETCRSQVMKARKAAEEKAEKEAARKARKAEANRRYREKKKAALEALKAQAVENIKENGNPALQSA